MGTYLWLAIIAAIIALMVYTIGMQLGPLAAFGVLAIAVGITVFAYLLH